MQNLINVILLYWCQKWDRDDGGGASLTNGKDELTASTPIYRRDRLVAVAHSLRNVREPSEDSGETVDEGASSIVGGRSFQVGSATRFGSLRRLQGSDAVSKSPVGEEWVS